MPNELMAEQLRAVPLLIGSIHAFDNSNTSPQGLVVSLENRLADAHRQLQLVEQENTVLHNLLLQSQTSLNKYAQDIEEQMLQVGEAEFFFT